MKRLFRILDLKTDSLLPTDYEEKPDAKRARDLLEGPRDVEAPRRYVVTPGPDHRNWNFQRRSDDDGRDEKRAA